MNTLPRIGRSFFVPWLVGALALAAGAPAGRPADATPPLPPGIIDFAGRISHNHWYLFGAEQRAELEALNRDLREAQQQSQKAAGETARQAAGERLADAAGRRRLELVLPPIRYCMDNAAMVAGIAYPLYTAGRVSDLTLDVCPTERRDKHKEVMLKAEG